MDKPTFRHRLSLAFRELQTPNLDGTRMMSMDTTRVSTITAHRLSRTEEDDHGLASNTSQQTPHSKRPVMLARDAEGESDAGSLKDIVSFLRDTEPSEISHATALPYQKMPIAQRRIVTRVLRVSGRKTALSSPSDSLRNRSSQRARNAITSQRMSESGHKYIHITPRSTSLDLEPFEIEANRSRILVTARPPIDDVDTITALPSFEPWGLSSPNLTTTSDGDPSELNRSTDIRRFVAVLEDGVQKRFKSNRRSRSGSPVVLTSRAPKDIILAADIKLKTDVHGQQGQLTPRDGQVNAYIRAAAGRKQRAPARKSKRSSRDSASVTTSRALGSYPAKSPSPPPNKPLPAVPEPQHSTGPVDDSHIHPLLRSQDSSPNSFRLRQQPVRFGIAPTLSAPNLPHIVHQTADSYELEGEQFETSQPVQNPGEVSAAQTGGEYITTGYTLSSGLLSTSTDVQATSSSPTPSRGERTRARKLRHLTTAKSAKEIKPFPLPTPDPSPTTSEAPAGSRPSTAGMPSQSLDAALVDSIKESPIPPTLHDEQENDSHSPLLPSSRTPTLSQGHSTHRLSNFSETSPTFADDDVAFSEPLISSQVGDAKEEEEEEDCLPCLLPPIRLSGLREKERPTRRRSSTTTDPTRNSFGLGFPMPQRHSFGSARTSFSSHRLSQPPSHPPPSPPTSISLAAARSQTAAPSRNTEITGLSSRNSLDAHVAHLERQNALLEAALTAVLRTGGQLNGCPCKYEKEVWDATITFKADCTVSPENAANDTDGAGKDNHQHHQRNISTASAATFASKITTASQASSFGSVSSRHGSKALRLYMATRVNPGKSAQRE